MHPLASRVCFFCAGLQDFLQNVLRSFGQALWDIQGITLTNFVLFFAETHVAQNYFSAKSMLIKIGVVVLWVSTFDSLNSLGYQFGRAADKNASVGVLLLSEILHRHSTRR